MSWNKLTDSAVVAGDGGVVISLRVQPKASRNAVVIETDGRLRVALTAPPVDGAANDALIRFMAGQLGVKRRELSLRSGERGREKVLFLMHGTVASVRGCLETGH